MGRSDRTPILVDSHCHLDFPDFASELDSVLARARSAGVSQCLTIGTTLAKSPDVLAVAQRAAVYCSVGVHPHEAQVEPLSGPDALLQASEHPKVIGFGESGLDYYYHHSPREQQIANFRVHCAAARAAHLPVIVHTRDAEHDTIEVLGDEREKGRLTGVIHCFTGTPRLARAALDIGFYISVSGIATFKKAEDLRATLKDVPLDRLLVETDAPYLAPQPVRGKRNEPAFVVHTAQMLADLKGINFETLAKATTDNFFRLFTKAKPA
ncbi:MAG: TatD family hydrolase [Alphaproteobacteria bacterium]